MKKGSAKKMVHVKEVSTEGSIDRNEFVGMSLRPPKSLYERLRKLSFETRIPMSTYIERGIEMVLKAEKY